MKIPKEIEKIFLFEAPKLSSWIFSAALKNNIYKDHNASWRNDSMLSYKYTGTRLVNKIESIQVYEQSSYENFFLKNQIKIGSITLNKNQTSVLTSNF
ncbi:hypothetical protein BpHYR1_050907 [Brachionus plicatilis]|uniref:Uncharacterized protein n=1 Tax=Brachionus plicatilis TaxID=10195 RepID=A0A3M7RJC9_BRAPC|nr:hypothetical protein BpHYR1_050907 [Brachionus plicatilis]